MAGRRCACRRCRMRTGRSRRAHGPDRSAGSTRNPTYTRRRRQYEWLTSSRLHRVRLGKVSSIYPHKARALLLSDEEPVSRALRARVSCMWLACARMTIVFRGESRLIIHKPAVVRLKLRRLRLPASGEGAPSADSYAHMSHNRWQTIADCVPHPVLVAKGGHKHGRSQIPGHMCTGHLKACVVI